MAKLVLTDAFVSINASEVSNRARSVTLNYEADAVEDTTMGAGTHTFLGGLKNYSIDVQFANDFADNDLDEDLFALVGTAVAVEIRPDNAARSAANPGYNATMLVASYSPFPGVGVGALAEASLRLVPGGASPTLLRSVT